jgi:hypothetical protein
MNERELFIQNLDRYAAKLVFTNFFNDNVFETMIELLSENYFPNLRLIVLFNVGEISNEQKITLQDKGKLFKSDLVIFGFNIHGDTVLSIFIENPTETILRKRLKWWNEKGFTLKSQIRTE